MTDFIKFIGYHKNGDAVYRVNCEYIMAAYYGLPDETEVEALLRDIEIDIDCYADDDNCKNALEMLLEYAKEREIPRKIIVKRKTNIMKKTYLVIIKDCYGHEKSHQSNSAKRLLKMAFDETHDGEGNLFMNYFNGETRFYKHGKEVYRQVIVDEALGL